MLRIKKVKTIVAAIHGYATTPAEPTVQHEETPQPPPPNPREGIGDEQPPPDPAEQEKEDMTFRISFESHLGHFVSASCALVFWKTENLSLHPPQIYS